MVTYKKYFDIEVFEGKLSKHQYPWHFHNGYTIILVEKGLITYELSNQKIEIETNEVLIIEPFLIHQNKITQPTKYKAIFIPTEYLTTRAQHKIPTQIIRLPQMVDCFNNLLHQIKLNEHYQGLHASLDEFQAFIQELPEKNHIVANTQHNTITDIDYDLTINELSEKAHLSKFHFQRKFKQYNGLTVGQLKQQAKTIKAKMLLENGRLSTDVAYELGFFDQSHFIKYFKKMWATTPKKFK